MQVRYRHVGKPLIARVAIDAVRGALQPRASDILVSFVHLYEQFDIERRVFSRKGDCQRTMALGQGCSDQTVNVPPYAGDLRSAVVAGVSLVSQQYPRSRLVCLG